MSSPNLASSKPYIASNLPQQATSGEPQQATFKPAAIHWSSNNLYAAILSHRSDHLGEDERLARQLQEQEDERARRAGSPLPSSPITPQGTSQTQSASAQILSTNRQTQQDHTSSTQTPRPLGNKDGTVGKTLSTTQVQTAQSAPDQLNDTEVSATDQWTTAAIQDLQAQLPPLAPKNQQLLSRPLKTEIKSPGERKSRQMMNSLPLNYPRL